MIAPGLPPLDLFTYQIHIPWRSKALVVAVPDDGVEIAPAIVVLCPFAPGAPSRRPSAASAAPSRIAASSSARSNTRRGLAAPAMAPLTFTDLPTRIGAQGCGDQNRGRPQPDGQPSSSAESGTASFQGIG